MDSVHQAISWWLRSKCPVAGVPTVEALLVLSAYILFLAVFGLVLPGRTIQGAVLADKTRIEYKCNGFRLLALLLSTLAFGAHKGLISPSYIADHAGELFTTANLIALALSLVLYVTGRMSRSKEASLKPHMTGNVIMDWWLGVQLNPRVFGIDIKFFWLRPSMMAWLVINLSVAAKQVQERGAITVPMALYHVFTAVYVVDYFWHEEYMTSTWDIIAENFGYMLIFGDFIFIPWTFSIQAWWLLHHSPKLSRAMVMGTWGLFIIGYTIFRGANKQKHIFKQNPKALIWGQPPKLIGGKLLVSGYWGLVRKANYLGDLLLALSYTIPCGFSSPVPYFYPTYLLILLLHRARRDDARCREKYRETWEEYCKAVPYCIFPGIY